jgi:hypothetical protein
MPLGLRYTSQWRSQGVRPGSGTRAGSLGSAGGSAENISLTQTVHDGIRTVEGVLVQATQRFYELVDRAVVLGMASQLIRRSWVIETLERLLYLRD